jgi:hypothetical protein
LGISLPAITTKNRPFRFSWEMWKSEIQSSISSSYVAGETELTLPTHATLGFAWSKPPIIDHLSFRFLFFFFSPLFHFSIRLRTVIQQLSDLLFVACTHKWIFLLLLEP